MMKQVLKSLSIEALGAANAYPTAVTSKTQLLALIDELRPVSAGIELLRLGPNGDGGYLVPGDLEGIEACFSPGVSDISGFEEDCARRGMQVFLADRSVDGPAVANERFAFTKKHVGALTSADVMTLDDWVGSSLPGSTADLMLQIDIEGHEYETFLSASPGLMSRFRVIVAEFHALDHLWSAPFFQLAAPAFRKILQTHRCVHIHPNNCCGALVKDGLTMARVMEFTFLRTDRVRRASFVDRFPHPLDFDNTANPALPLPACWYY